MKEQRTKMAGFESKVRLSRLLTIDEAVRSGKYPNTGKLAAITEMNPRTIQRDIEYMRDMFGAPIEYDAARRGYYYTEPNFFIKSVPLCEGELFSIVLFEPLLEQYRNTPLAESLRAIFAKIIRSLPDNVSINANFLTERMSFIPDDSGAISLETFNTIFIALKQRVTISFDYRPLSKSEHTKRRADPYHAICHRGNWYFIGFCHERREPRMFAFSRARNAALTKEKFEIPADFNARDYFDKEMGVWASARTPYTVELLISKEIAAYALDRRWHSSAEVKQNGDGSVSVKFTTTQMPEVFRWVLGQGSTVKVISPSELVRMIKDETDKMRGMYEE